MFIFLGSPNSNEAPNDIGPAVQSLAKNGQVAITIPRFFGCCNGSYETVPARNSKLNKKILNESLDQVEQLLDGSDAASRWAGWALAHPEFGPLVNPITTRGADYAHHITASPPGFENPAAQSLPRNGEVAIPIRCFFGCWKCSNEIVTARNSNCVQAIQDGSLDQVKQFIDIDGINVNLKEANNITYLQTAVFNNQVEIAKYLLSKGAEISVLSSEAQWTTPFHIAAEKGYLEVCDKIKIKIKITILLFILSNEVSLFQMVKVLMEGYKGK